MKVSKMTKKQQLEMKEYHDLLKLANKEIKAWEKFKSDVANKMDILRKKI